MQLPIQPTTTRTRTLEGPALDWAAAKARGYKEIHVFRGVRPGERGWIEVRFNPEPRAATARYSPSTHEIDAEAIISQLDELMELPDGTHLARLDGHNATGPTRLIAATRCFVVARIGGRIQVPMSLLPSEERHQQARRTDAGRLLDTLRSFLERTTHWQEGIPARHDALQALDALEQAVEESGAWQKVAVLRLQQLQSGQEMFSEACGHLDTALNDWQHVTKALESAPESPLDPCRQKDDSSTHERMR